MPAYYSRQFEAVLGESRNVRGVMQADEVLLQEMERLLNGANVHVGRTLMCRYVSECCVGKKPELINSLHDELTQWIAAEIRKNTKAQTPSEDAALTRRAHVK